MTSYKGVQPHNVEKNINIIYELFSGIGFNQTFGQRKRPHKNTVEQDQTCKEKCNRANNNRNFSISREME